jgi:four helix bundle protein
MDTHNFSFENLEVYSKARNLVKDIYLLQKQFPLDERFALGDQVRRAAVSITANIAEGSGRKSLKEQIHFLEIAYGSLMEVYNQLLIAIALTYITKESVDSIKPTIDAVAKMINGLSKTYSEKLS